MLDDESLLSAYLDDELDPAGRLEVESALLTDPRLAEMLHELAGVRELLAGLPRPEVPRVLAVEDDARRGRRRATRPSHRAIPPAIAAAAALLIAMPLGWRWLVGQEAHRPVRRLVTAVRPTPTPKDPQGAPVVAVDERTRAPEIVD